MNGDATTRIIISTPYHNQRPEEGGGDKGPYVFLPCRAIIYVILSILM